MSVGIAECCRRRNWKAVAEKLPERWSRNRAVRASCRRDWRWHARRLGSGRGGARASRSSRGDPVQSVLHAVVWGHFETFRAQAASCRKEKAVDRGTSFRELLTAAASPPGPRGSIARRAATIGSWRSPAAAAGSVELRRPSMADARSSRRSRAPRCADSPVGIEPAVPARYELAWGPLLVSRGRHRVRPNGAWLSAHARPAFGCRRWPERCGRDHSTKFGGALNLNESICTRW